MGPLINAGAAELVIANRSVDKALSLVTRTLRSREKDGSRCARRRAGHTGEAFGLVVNATATSLTGAAILWAHGVLRPGTLALDMMYGPSAQAFLDWAGAHGAIGRDGLGMLVEQAAEAFLFWRGTRPETATVLAALRQRLASA